MAASEKHPVPTVAPDALSLVFGLLVVVLTLVAGTVAPAQGLGANIPVVDENATMADRLGESIPTDLTFSDESGRDVTLGSLLPGDRPVVLNLGYFGCPGVCQAVTNTLADCLAETKMLPGPDVDVWTVSIDPREGARMAGQKESSYLDLLGLQGDVREDVASHWHFLTSREDGVAKRLADAVGWRYAWNDATNVYDHPPTVVLVSPSGVVTRYLSIQAMSPTTMRRAVVEASEGKVGTFLEQLFVSCMTWDPESESYSLAMFAMRIGGVITLLALGGMMAALFLGDRKKKGAGPEGRATEDPDSPAAPSAGAA